jgi:peptide deformylase
MAILPILIYPDPRLKQISPAVESFDDSLRQLIADLNETLYDAPGCVGIAAPQVGALHRLIIIDASRNAKAGPNLGKLILINPEIVESEGEVIAREGCLSLPHLTANVKRAKQIKVKALNENGETLTFHTQDFEARVILHEYDHLDGLLFLDRVASLKTDVFRRKNYTPKPEDAKLVNQGDLIPNS